MINKDGKTVAPTVRGVPGRRRQRRLEVAAGLRRDPRQPAGRGILADDGRDLDPDLQAAAGRRRPLPRRSSSSPGPTTRAARWPRSSTTSRCRTNVVDSASRRPGRPRSRTRAASRSTRWRTDDSSRKRRRTGAFSSASRNRVASRLVLAASRPLDCALADRGSRRCSLPGGDPWLTSHCRRDADRRPSRHRGPRCCSRLRLSDIIFRILTRAAAIAVLVLLGGVIVSLIVGSLPALQRLRLRLPDRPSAGTR